MGNCVTSSKSNLRSMSLPKSRSVKHISAAATASGKSESLANLVAIHSPISDRGDHGDNWEKTPPKSISRIPVRTLFSNDSNISKSSQYLRLSNSRIPVTQKNAYQIEKTVPMKDFSLETENSPSQLNESGFVSDFSVTNSGLSQTNETRTDNKIISYDSNDAVTERHQKSNNMYMTQLSSPLNESSLLGQSSQKNKKHSSVNKESILAVPKSSSQGLKKNAITVNTRRPQSLSCESELIIQKLHSKRLSEISNSGLSPSSTNQDHSSILQEVSNLKLMLHKLRRSLLQEPNDASQMDSLFRSTTPICTDIKLIPREELELKYEKLLARNIHLERLLQSREKVIAQMQSRKEGDENQPTYRSPIMSHTESFSPTYIKSINDIPPLQCTKLKQVSN